MPDYSGTYATLRFGLAAGRMRCIHCFAIRIPTKSTFGAGDGIRTRDICLGKATLYH